MRLLTLITLFALVSFPAFAQPISADHPGIQALGRIAAENLAPEKDSYDVVTVLALDGDASEPVGAALGDMLRADGWNVIGVNQTDGTLADLGLDSGRLPAGQNLRKFLITFSADAVISVDATVVGVEFIEAKFAMADFATESVIWNLEADVALNSTSTSFLQENRMLSLLIIVGMVAFFVAVRRARG